MIGQPVLAQDPSTPKESGTKLSVKITTRDEAKEIAENWDRETIHAFFNIIQNYGNQDENSMFRWNPLVSRLPVDAIDFTFTTSDDPKYADLLTKNVKGISKKQDLREAHTIASKTRNKFQINVVVFLDKIYFDGNQVRPDSDVRFIVALTRECYGSVTTYLNMDPKSFNPSTYEVQPQQEALGYEASVLFLQKIIPDFTKKMESNPDSKETLAEMTEQMKQALIREQSTLAKWQSLAKKSKSN